MIGVCIGETSPSQVEFISREVPQKGEYVVLEYQGVRVLGMVETLLRGSPYITDGILDPDTVLKILDIEKGRREYIRGTVKLLGDLETLELPRTPPPPGTKIHRAEDTDLQQIFPRDGLRIGTLLSHPSVAVRLDTNKMVTRHLAVLAITGAGKSNTIAVLIDQLLENNACILVFDMHSEYTNSSFKNTNTIQPTINPRYLSPGEFTRLLNITGKAYIEERHARAAYQTALKTVQEEGGDFLETMKKELERRKEDETYKNDIKSITGVQNKLDDFQEKYGPLLNANAKDIIDQLKLASVNILDLGLQDETISDVLVSHVLRRLLQSRKKHTRNRDGGLPYPVFTIIEEAHIFVPHNRSTDSKYWIARIAREGRKFGIGLCLVSQRPKSLDPEALSQANNMIILRLVEPGDQRHVQQASESLSTELLELLPGLNIGEAIILGMMTRIPALVKIDRFQGNLGGGDPDVIKIWRQKTEEQQRHRERNRNQLEDIYDW